VAVFCATREPCVKRLTCPLPSGTIASSLLAFPPHLANAVPSLPIGVNRPLATRTGGNSHGKPKGQTWLEFEIEIDAPDAEGIAEVQLLRAPGGDAKISIDLSALSPEVRTWGETPGADAAQAKSVGGELFSLLFSGDILSRYDVSKQIALKDGAGLRIRLRLAEQLRQLPWELLYDARSDDFLALSRTTPLVRYIPSSAPVESLYVEPPLRILAMAASPADLPPVDMDAEKANLAQALDRLSGQKGVEVVWLEGQQFGDLQRALQEGPWHIFHYVGHARLNPQTGLGEALLADEKGVSSPIDAASLATLLEDHSTLRLVVLNACEGARANEAQPFGSLAAALAQRGLPAVLAMQQEISTGAAQHFTRAFYGAVASRLPVDAALAEARKAMQQSAPDSTEWATPALFLRAPDGLLFGSADDLQARRATWMTYGGAAAALVILIAIIFWRTMPQPTPPTPTLAPTATPTITPTPTPTPTPVRMSGIFNVAIAEFGELDEDGVMRTSEEGRILSSSMFSEIQDQLRENPALVGGLANIQIWNDSEPVAGRNAPIGFVDGADAAERERAASTLAERLGAQMVVYGFLDNTITQTRGSDLVLDFYYKPPIDKGEPSVTAGAISMGKPLTSRTPLNSSDIASRGELLDKSLRRARLLFYITTGLTWLINNNTERAAEVFASGKADIANWIQEDGTGGELLDLYIAQTALIQRDYQTGLDAIDEALSVAPDYPNAMLLKGALLLDGAQIYYVGESVSLLTEEERLQVEEQLCTTPEDFGKAPQTAVEAEANANEAVEWLEKGIDAAHAANLQGIEYQGRLSLGLAYRLLGQIAVDKNAWDEADAWLQLAETELNEAREWFMGKGQWQYIGWTLAGLGATNLNRYASLRNQSDDAFNPEDMTRSDELMQEALDALTQSVAYYDECLEVPSKSPLVHLIFEDEVLRCNCEFDGNNARAWLEQAGEDQ
jgi:tetratricopeptide (TPR) repeat protein